MSFPVLTCLIIEYKKNYASLCIGMIHEEFNSSSGLKYVVKMLHVAYLLIEIHIKYGVDAR